MASVVVSPNLFQVGFESGIAETLAIPGLVLDERGLDPSFGWLIMMLMPFGMA